MQRVIWCLVITAMILMAGCADKQPNSYVNGNAAGQQLQVTVMPGAHWTHKMPIMGMFKLKNHPQMAIWIEDEEGKFIQNIYVTRKSGKQGWMHGPGDPTPKGQVRRLESLPYWMHKQNREFEPGVLMPTAKNPLPQHITSATPRKTFTAYSAQPSQGKYYIMLELNQSTDFNDYFAASKAKGEAGYSGGNWGSGQPSLIYRVLIDRHQPGRVYQMQLIGHGSPDGTDGELSEDMSKLSTATEIISAAKVVIN